MVAEVNTAEETAKVDAAFGAGFGDTPPPAPPVAKVEDRPVAEPAPKLVVTAPAPKPEKPEYVRVTKQDWEKHNAMFGKVASLESSLAKLTGSMPNEERLTQQIIAKVRSETPAGQVVAFSKEDFAEIAEDYPDLAERLEKVLNRGKVKGTGPIDPEKTPPAGAGDPVDIDKAVETALTRRAEKEATVVREKEGKDLLEAYPNYREILGSPDVTDGPPKETPWRKWLATQPADYQEKTLATWSPAEVKASIDKFTNDTKAPPAPAKPDKAAIRRAITEDAVTPRTDGAAPPLNQPPSVDDAFASGYKTARR